MTNKVFSITMYSQTDPLNNVLIKLAPRQSVPDGSIATKEAVKTLTLDVDGLVDISKAFLQTDEAYSNVGSKRTFLRPPEGVEIPYGKVLEILKSIYGLRTD